MERKTNYTHRRTIPWQVFFYLIFIALTETAAQLQYSIPEELKHGSVIGNIAKDLGINSKDLSVRKFHVVFRGKIQYFNVNLETGDISVAERIDREAMCGMKQTCLISFEAVIENPLQLFTVKVEIQDVNDNSPNFLKNSFDIVIIESALPGVRLALENAQDDDLGPNSVQKYQINDNEFFRLEEKITDGIKYPELILEKALDREKQNHHQLILTAMDSGKPARTGTAFIRISVHDVNDNFPKFSKDTYHITLNENSPIGFLVLHLDAMDEDEGSNAQITYSFGNVPENVRNMFAVDPVGGNISVVGNLDFEMTEEYKFTVEAKDGGGLVAHCKVSIQIVDVNDNPPEIKVTSLTTEIPEDSPPGTVVALINVHDLDTGDNGKVFCHISEKMPFQLVSSSPNYYKLETTANVDRERASEYKIRITAVDTGAPPLSSERTIDLMISDVNDNPPVFEKQSYIIYIPENNQAGLSIHSLYSSDLDLNDNGKIAYNILNSNIEDIPVSSYVSINSMTGVIYAQRSFDYEQLREFQFQVMAKDSGSPPLSSNVTVRICIIDKNDNAPKILYPSADTEGSSLFEFIPHSAEKGYLVTKVIAVDADSGHNAWLSYHLLQVPEPSLYTIGQQNGEIKISRAIPDLESLRQKVTVLVKDNGSPSLSSTVTLNIVVAENFQQVVPGIRHEPISTESSADTTFYLVVSIALISIIFIVTVMVIAISKCRKTSTPTSFGNLGGHVYPQFTLGCPSEISDTSLPFPFSYDVCVTLDSKQNEIAYLKPLQNVPTENLIDTDDSATTKDGSQTTSVLPQAQPNGEWRFSQAQRPGPSGAQPAEEAGVWPNNQFETERLQAMILASANEAAEGTSGLGGGTGTMGLSARYGPQFTLQHVPDYRQNVYIPGSTLTPTNAGGKRDGKGGGNKKKSGKKDKK
ncbi:protocadherin gamma-B2-like isoform X43 [Hyla sarda]|uniref:protocadherin gamma-B2-like isoform X43 n=1 Tax=Hyla sarda TaxID=327740 RepID=UPI0024C3E2F4|nr:protocadherin gamma-B2-like isoform X43 [Hyla sarda]